MKHVTITLLFTTIITIALSQPKTKSLPTKVSHAEPIFFDLIRDLGARRGEKELNVGIGMARFKNYTVHSYLVEYEFAPVNRVGMELEIPFAFHTTSSEEKDLPSHGDNGIEGIKAAVQYSFFVSEKMKTTLAVGYIFETKRKGFDLLRTTGSIHNPFFIAAKKWGNQFHTLIYTGLSYEHDRENSTTNVGWLLNTGVHYVLQGTKNFIGLEANQEIVDQRVETVLRPQVKLVISQQSSLGLAVGIPLGENERNMDFLFRWIYEPNKKS
jgi:hypothetical protein